MLELPISARPPKQLSPPAPPKKNNNKKRSIKSPSSVRRNAGNCYYFLNNKCTRLRSFALVLRIVALVLHFDFCSENFSDQFSWRTGQPGFGETLEAGKSVRLPDFGDDPWFCNMFGPRYRIWAVLRSLLINSLTFSGLNGDYH